MNRYGAMAQRHWETFLPSRVAAIPNPQEYFTKLGQRVAEEIDQLTDQLMEQHPAASYLERVGQRTAARRAAEEKVLAEQVLLPPEPGQEQAEDSTNTSSI